MYSVRVGGRRGNLHAPYAPDRCCLGPFSRRIIVIRCLVVSRWRVLGGPSSLISGCPPRHRPDFGAAKAAFPVWNQQRPLDGTPYGGSPARCPAVAGPANIHHYVVVCGRCAAPLNTPEVETWVGRWRSPSTRYYGVTNRKLECMVKVSAVVGPYN